jgi:hypothetical protein
LNQRHFAPDAAVLAINLWRTTLPKTGLAPPRMMAWCGRCLTAGKASTAFLKRVTVIVWQAWRFKEYEQMCKLGCYGLSADAIADVLLKDPQNSFLILLLKPFT